MPNPAHTVTVFRMNNLLRASPIRSRAAVTERHRGQLELCSKFRQAVMRGRLETAGDPRIFDKPRYD